jgi:hydrogenase expression/formation protein HypC
MMCLGIPGEVLEIRDEQGLKVGKVQFGGITRDVCLACIPDIALGEFVLVHVGFAISKVDKEEAARAYATLQELGLLAELTSDTSQPEQPP